MNILFISATVPYPATDGGRIRVLNLLKRVAKSNNVTFLALETLPTDRKGIEYLRNLGVETHLSECGIRNSEFGMRIIACAISRKRPLTVAKYYVTAMESAIKQLIQSQMFDVIHFEMLHTGQYLQALPDLRAPTLLSLQNIDSAIWRRLARQTGNPLKKLIFWMQYRSFRRYEQLMAKKFSACACVSEEDKNLLADLCPGISIEVIPNGVDVESYQPDHSLTEASTIVYTGSMDWLPNEDAALYFHERIFPLIEAQIPDVKFYIVGQNPTERVKQLSQRDKVIVTGMVDDVKPYIAKASVYVVPLRIGGGTRLKILEALAMEKAVVSTTIGCEGLQLTPGRDIFIADEPEKFARLVIQLTKDEKFRRRLGKSGRRQVEEKYDWRSIGKQLNELYGILHRNRVFQKNSGNIRGN
ncbi:MAG: glycosyltransferase family 4 protein [Candidatus Poribacteria bacterium]